MKVGISQLGSLKTRATVFTLAIFVLGIWSLSLFVIRNLQTDLERMLGEQQLSVVTAVAKEVNENLTERLQALETVAKADARLMGDRAALQARLEQRPVLQLLFNGGVWVAGSDGTVIADVPIAAQRIGVNYMDRDFIAGVLKEGKPIIGRPVMGKKLKSPLFNIAVPMRDAQGKVMGVLSGVIDLGKPNFLDKITQSRYGQTGGYFLIAPQHQLFVTATDRSRVMQPLPAPGQNRMHDRYMQGYEGYGVAVSSRGELELSAAKAIPATGWYAASILPAQEAFAPIASMKERLLWASLLLTLLTGALTWWILKRQLAPLVVTADAMAALADSTQIPHPLPGAYQGEIGQLVGGFNRILQTWTQQEARLLHLKTMMEQTERAAHIASFEWEVEANTVTWSPEMFRIFGRDPALGTANLEGQASLYTPESTQLLYDAVGKALTDAMPYSLELMSVRSDGEQRPCFVMGYPQRDSSGRVVRLSGLVQDISERKQAEAALLISEARWKFAIEGSGDGLWDWNIQTGSAYFSTRYKTMLGFSEAEIGDTADEWSKRIHPDDAPGVFAAMQPYMDGKPGTATVEFRMLRKDRLWQWMMGRGMVMERDAQGKALRMIGINTDMTERRQAQMALRESEVRFRTMFELAADAIVLHRTGKLVFVNPAAVKMFGAQSENDLIGRPIVELIHPDDRAMIATRIKTALESGQTAPVQEGRYLRLDGTVFHADAQGQAIDLEGFPTVLSTLRDTSERRLAQEKLQLAAGVFTHALEGIMITAPDATIMDVNAAFTRITGYSHADAVGQNPRILKSGRQDMVFYEAMWRELNDVGHWSGEVWNRRKSGEVYAELLTISAVRDEHGDTQQFVALFSDITPMKEQQSQLEHIAHFDALTNLPNRLLLADRLQQAMAQAQRRGKQVAVAYLDLDGFKNVNDQHGHDVGDQLLIALATAMKDTLREGDTLARLGGDEFVAVLIDLDGIASCEHMLARLLGAASAAVHLDAGGGTIALQCSASIGVTFYPQPQGIEPDQLLRQADQAMYQAKLAGKNRYHFFDAAQDSSMRVHHESLERIRLALDRGEFVLHYQPKVNMHSGKVIGSEALIRWQHPEKGLLAPAAFLPVIEDHQLAVDVGEWVIDTALTQIELWRAVGLDLPVSVNIGARQLQQENFVQRLQALLARHPDVKASSLELEVLETSALADIAQVSQVIEACAAIGVKFALDDFGTGYSSLTYLKLLRVALLKIDQSFVRDMLDDPDDLAILEGVIGLALAFRREVIAEGVETVAHGTALLQLGCELAQGYGIARPMPPEQLPGWTAAWEPDAAWCELPWLGGQE
jgi:diguanylate cyclase (GGDEF)-like protein/PAS domain S-box-containing protein